MIPVNETLFPSRFKPHFVSSIATNPRQARNMELELLCFWESTDACAKTNLTSRDENQKCLNNLTKFARGTLPASLQTRAGTMNTLSLCSRKTCGFSLLSTRCTRLLPTLKRKEDGTVPAFGNWSDQKHQSCIYSQFNTRKRFLNDLKAHYLASFSKTILLSSSFKGLMVESCLFDPDLLANGTTDLVRCHEKRCEKYGQILHNRSSSNSHVSISSVKSRIFGIMLWTHNSRPGVILLFQYLSFYFSFWDF